MSQLDSIFRFGFTAFLGIAVAIFLGTIAGLLWAPLGWVVFTILTLFWLAVTLSLMARKYAREDVKLLASCQDWRKEQLPEEFRFIEHHTTLSEINKRIGPYARVRGEGDTRALQYNLPYGAAVLIFFDHEFDSNACVRGVKFFARRDEIRLFP